MIHQSPPRAWIEVDLEAIAHNLDIVRQLQCDAMLMPVVKAEAYGHGLISVARRLDRDGISFFGVANAGEARRLSLAGIRTPAFILGPSFPEERQEIVHHAWGCAVSSFDELEHYDELAAAEGVCFSLHLAIDTGMGREGFLPEQIDELIARVPLLEHIQVTGVMTHCPCADDDVPYTQQQLKLFAECVERLQPHFDLQCRHVAASAALLGYDVPCANMLRPGIVLYGVAPLASVFDGVLRPALKLNARVTLVRELPAGHGVSYGRRAILDKPTRVATVGIGYADGWFRSLSEQGAQVSIQGKLCPMLGRVTMDQIMVDVTVLPEVKSGDTVSLIGPQQSVEEVARLAGTIPWEVFTGLRARVPRVYH